MKLCIRNQGEIDLKALFLLGASTKDGQDKIGFFGSGNKYSMATLLRKGIPFSIYSGERLIEITTQNAELGGQTFQQIVIDGQPTSFTTRMGPSWETWFAIREFYCNAVDEGEASWSMTEAVLPEAGRTKIYIEAVPEIMEFWTHRGEYILDGTEAPLWSFRGTYGKTEVYEPAPGDSEPTTKIFRKGVLVYESQRYCAFWYNLEDVEINEARVAQYEFQLLTGVAQALTQASSKQYVERIVKAMHEYEYIESQAYWNYLTDRDTFSDAWVEEISTKTVIRKSAADYLPAEDVAQGFVLNDYAVARLEASRPELCFQHHLTTDFEEREMTETQQEWATNAQKELELYGYWNNGLSVVFGEFRAEEVMGLFQPILNKVYISIKHMALGYDEFCCTLIEEMLHAQGFRDGSRGFQNKLMKDLLYAKREKDLSFKQSSKLNEIFHETEELVG